MASTRILMFKVLLYYLHYIDCISAMPSKCHGKFQIDSTLVANSTAKKMGTPEENPLKEEKKIKKKTFKDKIDYIKENITVEPVLACYVVPGALARLATQNLNLDKACRVNMQYGDEICDALIARKGDLYMDQEFAIQGLIAELESYKNVLLTAIPSFLIIFLGAWSDRTGKRKICILLPIIGELLVTLSSILNAYYFYELPVQVTIFFEAFLPAITGGWITTYMGAFAYISDVSSEKSRTYRVGIANLCLTAGTPVGAVLSGILLDKIGYYGVFSLSALLYIFSIVYGFLCIKDPERIVTEKPKQNESSDVWSFLKFFFDMRHVKDTVKVAFKDGPNKRRIKSILVLSCIVFIYGPAYGEGTVRYLFTRNRFKWDALKYSFYSTFYIVIHALGALISISLFSRRFKWDDSVLGITSNVSKIIGSVTTALAKNTLDMYIAVAVEMFNATSFTALRSISSKLCTSDELGKMTSFFNLVEVATSMTFGPIYSVIYRYTIVIDPGIMYYVSTALTLPPLAIFLWFFITHRKDRRESRRKQAEDGVGTIEAEVNTKEDQLVRSVDLEHERVVVE